MAYDINPFPKSDTDRHELWEKLVRSDIDAFLSQNWSKVAGDFSAKHFMGIHGNQSANPDDWSVTYDCLDAYKNDWLKQAADFSKTEYLEDPREALFKASRLDTIKIQGDSAILHKKFDGSITQKNGVVEKINWQTVYQCKKENGKWKIIGFVGYLPNPMG